jgi:soluble lytic murein transglycosylase-like protein
VFDLNRALAHKWGRVYGVDAVIVEAMIQQESSGRDVATWEPKVSEYAWGRMQILASTAREVGFRGPDGALLAPENSVRYGCAYLASRLARFGDVWLAVDAYNKGTPEGPDTAYVRGVRSHIGDR